MAHALRDALVTPKSKGYDITNYSESPLVLSAALLKHPLDITADLLLEQSLVSTPLLTLFGLVVHRTTGLLLYLAQNNTSFAIRNDKFSLIDIFERSPVDRSQIRYISNFNPHKDSLKEDDSLSFEHLAGELQFISKVLRKEIPREVQFLNDLRVNDGTDEDRFGSIQHFRDPIPFLPIYLGINEFFGKLISPVCYSDPNYTTILKENQDKLVFYQKLYSTFGDARIIVNVKGPDDTVASPSELYESVKDSNTMVSIPERMVQKWESRILSGLASSGSSDSSINDADSMKDGEFEVDEVIQVPRLDSETPAQTPEIQQKTPAPEPTPTQKQATETQVVVNAAGKKINGSNEKVSPASEPATQTPPEVKVDFQGSNNKAYDESPTESDSEEELDTFRFFGANPVSESNLTNENEDLNADSNADSNEGDDNERKVRVKEEPNQKPSQSGSDSLPTVNISLSQLYGASENLQQLPVTVGWEPDVIHVDSSSDSESFESIEGTSSSTNNSKVEKDPPVAPNGKTTSTFSPKAQDASSSVEQTISDPIQDTSNSTNIISHDSQTSSQSPKSQSKTKPSRLKALLGHVFPSLKTSEDQLESTEVSQISKVATSGESKKPTLDQHENVLTTETDCIESPSSKNDTSTGNVSSESKPKDNSFLDSSTQNADLPAHPSTDPIIVSSDRNSVHSLATANEHQTVSDSHINSQNQTDSLVVVERSQPFTYNDESLQRRKRAHQLLDAGWQRSSKKKL
ncbi:BA75_00712T0 [Komagataella pastoris]|uniref:BA75_00712T0 n=1 Tax=Komagataella pastoris TaxID=4922 RepID=A0A1B2J822_PICPA|nr:BA75_00712T0 [Komagataella pastoris]